MNLNLRPIAVPSDTRFAGTLAGLLEQIQQHMQIDGQDGFDGIVIGSATPAVEDRDKAWLKTTGSGQPIGFFSWNGAVWTQVPVLVSRGTTAERPSTPEEGQMYLDTEINTQICFERGAWRTVSGTPGDIKFVAKATLAEALACNPGWVEFTNARGRVIGAAGVSAEVGISPRAYLDIDGSETHQLSTAELPAHSHSVTFANGTATAAGFGADSGLHGKAGSAGVGGITAYAPSTGGDTPHQNMQPTIFTWCLLKE